jgi:hypothetical protein
VTGLVEVLSYASGVSACVACVAAIVYMCWWAFARNGVRATSRSLDARLRFEAIWGIVLALPLGLALLALAASLSAQPLAAAGLVLVAVAFFAIPVAALRDLRLPPGVRWVPAGVAFSIGTPLAALTCYLVVPVLWYVAGCMVAVRFARAVRARDAERTFVPEHGSSSPMEVAER